MYKTYNRSLAFLYYVLIYEKNFVKIGNSGEKLKLVENFYRCDDFVTGQCYTNKVETHIIIQNRASVYSIVQERIKTSISRTHLCNYMEACLQMK